MEHRPPCRGLCLQLVGLVDQLLHLYPRFQRQAIHAGTPPHEIISRVSYHQEGVTAGVWDEHFHTTYRILLEAAAVLHGGWLLLVIRQLDWRVF
jgi:hypothetical protein